MASSNEYDVEKQPSYALTPSGAAYDIEKQPSAYAQAPSSADSDARRNDEYVDEGHAVRGESFEVGSGWYARVQRIAGKFNVEQRGIERVPEDERTDTGTKALLNVGTMWLAANMVVSSFALGLLPVSTFYLGTADAMLVVLFFNLLGITPVCYFSTFGPKFGLRQMVLSRFWYGWYGVKLSVSSPVIPTTGMRVLTTFKSPFSTSSPASAGQP